MIASHGLDSQTTCDNNQQPLVGLYIGSAKPHAAEDEARAAVVSPAQRISSASLRRLEPEIVEVLRFEPLPAVNVMPCSEAPAPEVELRPIPRPLTTDELIPKAMQQRLHQHRRRVAACFDRARRGGWKWARDHRPEPLVATEAEAMLPAGWGWKWEYNEETLKWLAMTPSSWPESPPDTTLEIDNLLEWALENKPEDEAIISYMSNGYPGPSLEPVAAIGSLHVGALKEIANFDKCTRKDRAANIGRWGCKLPPIWPCRADYRNVVMRRKKPRLTIDKSMRHSTDLPSHNDEVVLEEYAAIEYVTAGQLGRARAILLTAGVEVKGFSFDLNAYFKVTGKARSTWWMAGFVGDDGYGFDPRLQFEDRPPRCFCDWLIVLSGTASRYRMNS